MGGSRTNSAGGTIGVVGHVSVPRQRPSDHFKAGLDSHADGRATARIAGDLGDPAGSDDGQGCPGCLVLVVLEHVSAKPRTALAEVPSERLPARPTSAGTTL